MSTAKSLGATTVPDDTAPSRKLFEPSEPNTSVKSADSVMLSPKAASSFARTSAPLGTVPMAPKEPALSSALILVKALYSVVASSSLKEPSGTIPRCWTMLLAQPQ